VRKLKEESRASCRCRAASGCPGADESDLVDQINLMVFPVMLGTGKKPFEEKSERPNLRLRNGRSSATASC
jgi:hypothetical protein